MLSRTRRRLVIVSLVVISAVIAVVSFGGGAKAEVEPTGFFAPVITATMSDAFTDADGDSQVEPGQEITYTVTINNTAAAGAGNDATGEKFSDTLPSSLTLVNGSLTVSPIAIPDTYVVTGNVQINVPAASGVLVNDISPRTAIPA